MKIERKVNYYETDAMKIVHHSNYIRYFEEARIELLSQLGLPYSKIEQERIMIPVLGVECKYMTASKFEDILEINCKLKEYTGIKFVVEYSIFNKTSNKMSVIGQTKHCFTNNDLKPISLKKVNPDMHEVFQKALNK